jgi:hypothetical protein
MNPTNLCTQISEIRALIIWHRVVQESIAGIFTLGFFAHKLKRRAKLNVFNFPTRDRKYRIKLLRNQTRHSQNVSNFQLQEFVRDLGCQRLFFVPRTFEGHVN